MLASAHGTRARLVLLASGNGSNAAGRHRCLRRGRPAGRGRGRRSATRRCPGAAASRPTAASPTSTSASAPARRVPTTTPAWPTSSAASIPTTSSSLGWMRILTMSFLGWFPGMVINLHPALPGELPGTDAIERAFARVRNRGERTSHRRHGAPGSRRGRRRRPGARHAQRSRSSPTTRSRR